jgi:dTDP-4-dehydrorhamnose reductase
MKTLLITGADGFVGGFLSNYLSKEFRVYPTVMENKTNSGNLTQMDITNSKNVDAAIKKINPDIILHLAGIKDVKFCEQNPKIAELVNKTGTANVSTAAEEAGAFMVYLSTDYVFDGKTGMYKEDDPAIPETVYGKTKLAGENEVGKICTNYSICRASGIYDFNGKNILSFILGELKAGKKQEYYTDVSNSPTYIANLSDMIKKVIELRKTTTYHLSGKERASRHELALKAAEIFKLDKSLVVAKELGEEKRKGFLLPHDVSLDTSTSEKILKMRFLTVNEGLTAVKRQMQL